MTGGCLYSVYHVIMMLQLFCVLILLNSMAVDTQSSQGANYKDHPTEGDTLEKSDNKDLSSSTKEAVFPSSDDAHGQEHSVQEEILRGKRSGLNEKRKWNNMAAWGKRDPSSSMDHSDIPSFNDKREWKDMAAWGKRDTSSSMDHSDIPSLNDKRKWNNMAAWGKRDTVSSMDHSDIPRLNDKREWNSMAAWGKRDTPSSLDLSDIPNISPDFVKKWSSNFNSWGKRNSDSYLKKWSSMNSWGKRDSGLSDDIKNKRWSSLNSWGKRTGNTLEGLDLDKKWAKGMNTWGKRDESNIDTDDLPTEGKRWAKTMNAWGKRDSDPEYEKKWAKSMSSWGKRDNILDGNSDIEKRWAKSMNSWGKRDDSFEDALNNDKRWAKSMNTWGKRDALYNDGLENIKRWAQMNSWGKRSDPLEDDDNDRLWRILNAQSDPTTADKRWAKVMNSWGKRWSNAINSWGKRWSSQLNSWGKRGSREDESSSMNSARKEGPMNLFRSYALQLEDTLDPEQERQDVLLSGTDGKDQYFGSDTSQTSDLPAKRGWSPKFNWIKRTNYPFFGGPKRGWRGHDLNVWGKRSSWQGLHSWGKREAPADPSDQFNDLEFDKDR